MKITWYLIISGLELSFYLIVVGLLAIAMGAYPGLSIISFGCGVLTGVFCLYSGEALRDLFARRSSTCGSTSHDAPKPENTASGS
jgi:hypothetical protein